MELLTVQSFFGAHGASWIATWMPLSLMAVMVAVIIYTTLYMFGRSFSIKELETFAKSELLQAAANAFIVIFLVTMVGSAMQIAQTFISGELQCGGQSINIGSSSDPFNGNSTMDQAYYAIECRAQQRALEVANIQDAIISSSGTAAELNALNLGFSLFGITVFKGDWVGSLYQSTETARITNNLATVLLIGLDAESSLLQYLQLNMLNIFVPVGILMRSFFFTRGPGALLIAVGIGMYFIFPIFFVLLDPGFTASPPPSSVAVPKTPPYCYATMSNTVSLLSSIQSAGLGSTAGLTLTAAGDDLSKSYVDLLLHPLVAFFLTMVFIRYMMTVLGGDSYELTKMVSKLI